MYLSKVWKTGNYRDVYKGEHLVGFSDRCKTEEDCENYLSEMPWSTRCVCLNDGHSKSQIRMILCRIGIIYYHTERPTAGTLFYKLKFSLRKVFLFCFEIVTTVKSLLSSQDSVRDGIRETAARAFMYKVRSIMESSSQAMTNEYREESMYRNLL